MSMYFYIYKIVDTITGEFYFGSRKSNVCPHDDSYMGSMVKWKPNKDNLEKIIIKDDFDSYENLIDFEKLIIKEHKNDPLNRNYSIPNEKFYLTRSEDTIGEKNGFYGKSHTDEHRKNLSEKFKGANNPNHGKKWMYKNDIQKYVNGENVNDYLKNGWKFGNISSKLKTPYNTKRVWITNGIENKYVEEKDFLLPEGWKRGKTYSEAAKSKFRSQLNNSNGAQKSGDKTRGTIFINNGEINLRIMPEEINSYLENGWKKGRWQKAWNSKT